jgi:hypothetical protein
MLKRMSAIPKKNIFAKLTRKSLLLITIFTMVLAMVFVPKSHAAVLNNVAVYELAGSGSAMVASAGNTLVIGFTAASTGAPTTITLALGAAWTGAGGAVAATDTNSTAACASLFPASTAITPTSGVTGSGSTITIPYTTSITSGTSYCIGLTQSTTVTNPSAGVYQATLTSGADSSPLALDILTASTVNTYSVTVSVLSTFTLSLSASTDTFNAPNTYLSPASVETTSGVTASVATNAIGGWLMWAEDTNGGLKSASTSTTLTTTCGSNDTFTAGSANYGLGVSAHNTANYAYTSSTHGSCLQSTQYNEIGVDASPSSDTAVLHELATVANTTPAANDYTDTINVIGAGSF